MGHNGLPRLRQQDVRARLARRYARIADSSIMIRLTIDPDAVARNWRRLARLARSECAAVVKADAYGHGTAAVAPALEAAGCTTFFVALEAEGHALRKVLSGATIYVLNGVFDDPRAAVEARLVPFLSSAEAIAEWPDEAPWALNVDTGMNRLGLTVREATGLAGRFAPVLIASHFACADTPEAPMNDAQERAFAVVTAAFPRVPASLANSAALLTRPHAHFDLVRPGIALYGGDGLPGSEGLEPTVRVEARVIQVRDVPPGGTVGYGAAQRVSRPSRIAIASLGYADGYLRAAGGSDGTPGAPASVNGIAARLVGRVSMDLVAIDVTDAGCRRGDYIELIGPSVPLSAVARHAGTIGYELLTDLSRRADRQYGPL